MNVLFLSLGEFKNFSDGSVHIDLIKKFSENHNVFLACKKERRECKKTFFEKKNNITLLNVRIGNIKNTNVFEKGISTILLELQFKKAIKKYLNNVKFDVIIYTTPPITFVSPVKYIKARDNAKSILLLKDIFPQNAVDLGLLKKNGIFYNFFRKKEKKLYYISDFIGCMSKENIDYTLRNNPEIENKKLFLSPNSINIIDKSIQNKNERCEIRKKYGLPIEKKIFVYGGNLGKPQGIDFLIECLEKESTNNDCYFLIIGSGTEYRRLENYYENTKQNNFKLLKSLQKSDYEKVVSACDVGMIFLDKRFTIPNIPSRMLSYMQAKLPILACTDSNTDLKDIIEEGQFGWWCESSSVFSFSEILNNLSNYDLKQGGENAWRYLNEHFSVCNQYEEIISKVTSNV